MGGGSRNPVQKARQRKRHWQAGCLDKANSSQASQLRVSLIQWVLWGLGFPFYHCVQFCGSYLETGQTRVMYFAWHSSKREDYLAEKRRGIQREGGWIKKQYKTSHNGIYTSVWECEWVSEWACVCVNAIVHHLSFCVVQMEISLVGLSMGLIVEKAHRHTAGKPVSRSKHTLFKSKGHALSDEASLCRERERY